MREEKKEERDIVYQSVPMNFTIGEGEYKTEVGGYGWTFYNRATPWIRSAPSPIIDANHPILQEGKEEKRNARLSTGERFLKIAYRS